MSNNKGNSQKFFNTPNSKHRYPSKQHPVLTEPKSTDRIIPSKEQQKYLRTHTKLCLASPRHRSPKHHHLHHQKQPILAHDAKVPGPVFSPDASPMVQYTQGSAKNENFQKKGRKSKNHPILSNPSLSDSAIDRPLANRSKKSNHPKKATDKTNNQSSAMDVSPSKHNQRTAEKKQKYSSRPSFYSDQSVSKLSKSFDELRSAGIPNLSNPFHVPTQSAPLTARRASVGSSGAKSTLYAGPTFHNSPAPSSLPIPAFGTPTKSNATPKDNSQDVMFAMEDEGQQAFYPHSNSDSMFVSLASSTVSSESDNSDEDDPDEDNDLRLRSSQLLSLLSAVKVSSTSQSFVDPYAHINTASGFSAPSPFLHSKVGAIPSPAVNLANELRSILRIETKSA